jgi:hypothetical protein
MQAPHPPQNKTTEKNKVWAKKTLTKICAINGSFWGQSIFWAARKIM